MRLLADDIEMPALARHGIFDGQNPPSMKEERSTLNKDERFIHKATHDNRTSALILRTVYHDVRPVCPFRPIDLILFCSRGGHHIHRFSVFAEDAKHCSHFKPTNDRVLEQGERMRFLL
jgi:hypothetical protein